MIQYYDLNSGCSMSILVNGRAVKQYSHEGLTFIEAKNGTEFSIEIKNSNFQRVLAIVSVDGLDVIDGKAASSDSRGYVISAFSNVKIKGWRKSEGEVGAFKFVSGKKSYAAGKGAGQNNGVIAVRLFKEKVKPLYPYKGGLLKSCKLDGGNTLREYVDNDGAWMDTVRGALDGAETTAFYSATKGATRSVSYSAAPSSMSAANFDTGTTWGTKLEDKVTTTEFERGEEICTMSIYYASRESLKEMGVPLETEQKISKFPQAFKDSFATPPKGWK